MFAKVKQFLLAPMWASQVLKRTDEVIREANETVKMANEKLSGPRKLEIAACLDDCVTRCVDES